MNVPKIKVEIENTEGLTKRDVVSVVVENELNDFNKWMVSTFQGTPPMTSFERAIVKTYIMHALEEQISKIPG